MIYQPFNAAWPPRFESQTCDPKSPNTMLKYSDVQRSLKQTQNRTAAVENGERWATGYVGRLSFRSPEQRQSLQASLTAIKVEAKAVQERTEPAQATHVATRPKKRRGGPENGLAAASVESAEVSQ